MKLAVKNLIVTGVVVSTSLLSLVAINKPVTAQSLETFNSNPINTEYNSSCHTHSTTEDEKESSSTKK
jgi:hypothetical protein